MKRTISLRAANRTSEPRGLSPRTARRRDQPGGSPWVLLVALGLLLIAGLAAAQEDTRRLERTGEHTKHLTPNQVDSWIFQAEKGEVVTARVQTRDFDAVVKLVDASGTVLEERDDPGSSSSLAFRLKSSGEHRIQVHAFKHSGGGNYKLAVDRFSAGELHVGKDAGGRIGTDGRSHYRFEARPGQILVPRVEGQLGGVEILDPQGKRINGWENTATIKAKGEHFLRLHGRRGAAYRLTLLAAEEFDLELDKPQTRQIAPGGLHVWSFSGEPGQFRVVEVEGGRLLASQLLPAAKLDAERDRAILSRKAPALRLLPISSKGDRVRHAVVIGRKDRYQLQLLSQALRPVDYTLKMAAPSVPIAFGKPKDASLAVGGADFYRLEAKGGQLIVAELTSPSFDSFLRLFRADGQELASNDDGGEHLNSRISLLVPESGTYRVQVTSIGSGGGGPYQIQVLQRQVPDVAVGGRKTAKLGPGGRDLWSFAGRRGQSVFASVRSSQLDAVVEVLAPSGASLGRDDDGGVGSDCLLAVELPEDGRYTVLVTSKVGEGEYQLRLIDGK